MEYSFFLDTSTFYPRDKPFLARWKGRTYLCKYNKPEARGLWDVAITRDAIGTKCLKEEEFQEYLTGWMPLPEVKVERKKRKKTA